MCRLTQIWIKHLTWTIETSIKAIMGSKFKVPMVLSRLIIFMGTK